MDLITFIGFVVIGGALAVPLLYGLATLLGMTHKQFHPILREKRPDGVTVQLMNDQAKPSSEQQPVPTQQGRKPWSRPDT